MTDQNDDFVSFEKALRDLQLQSEQLRKMVSQGDIRAFRVGESMQFRAEDIETLRSQGEGEDDLVFADALEDDTGMVTEELSDEDTLLVEDDLEDEEPVVAAAPAPRARSRRAAIEEEKVSSSESGLDKFLYITCAVALIWGSMIAFGIVSEGNPDDSLFTSVIWGKK